MKKVIALTLTFVMLTIVSSCAKSNSETTSASDAANTTTSYDLTSAEETSSSGSSNYSQYYDLVGFDIYIPDDIDLQGANIGKAFEFDGFSVIFAAPIAAGYSLDATDLEDAVGKCEKYITNTLELRNTEFFFADKTEQGIDEETKINNNGIDMLKVKGVFKNLYASTETEYVAYYFLRETDPVYIVGIQVDDQAASGLESFMDEMASHIQR